MPSGHNAKDVSDPQGKGRLSAKQPSGFAFGEMARFESKIRSAPPFQPKRAVATAVASATIEVAGRRGSPEGGTCGGRMQRYNVRPEGPGGPVRGPPRPPLWPKRSGEKPARTGSALNWLSSLAPQRREAAAVNI